MRCCNRDPDPMNCVFFHPRISHRLAISSIYSTSKLSVSYVAVTVLGAGNTHTKKSYLFLWRQGNDWHFKSTISSCCNYCSSGDFYHIFFLRFSFCFFYIYIMIIFFHYSRLLIFLLWNSVYSFWSWACFHCPGCTYI